MSECDCSGCIVREEEARGWTHEEAKKYTLIERLRERCGYYQGEGLTCPELVMDRDDWCERCLAAEHLQTCMAVWLI